jgi:hydrogenase maturation protein HypF
VKRRVNITITGRVQGVGFRPTVFRHATAAGLAGFVKNTPAGVVVEAEGEAVAVAEFIEGLRQHPPVQAQVDIFEFTDIPPIGEHSFQIVPSQGSGDLLIGIPPDLATCADCAREIRDPANRRHGYPFTNCTCCGPRYTIVRELPYDRAKTSMGIFKMCPACQAEYTTPLDRRFDAQPNACAACGPVLRLIDKHGETMTAVSDPIAAAAEFLRQGQVVALKGLGGYHLCCDAMNSDAIRQLRERKQRPTKPFAVMFRSLEEIQRHCLVDEQEAAELTSTAAPIVILRRQSGCALPNDLAPNTPDLGVFLPYTPLHH